MASALIITKSKNTSFDSLKLFSGKTFAENNYCSHFVPYQYSEEGKGDGGGGVEPKGAGSLLEWKKGG